MLGGVVEEDGQLFGRDLVAHGKLFGKIQGHPSTLELPVAALNLSVDKLVDLPLEYPGSLGFAEAGDLQDLCSVDPIVVAPPHQRDVVDGALVDVDM